MKRWSGWGWALAALAALAVPAAIADPPMRLSSPAFGPMEAIPAVHTCEGADRSPPLTIAGVPSGAKSLALIVTDPDVPDPAAPKRTWTHWVLYDLPPDTRELAGGLTPAELPEGARAGRNDWGRPGYGGPCPPIGRHRYVHALHALDVVLGDLDGPDRAALERTMEGHVLTRAELVGTYQRDPLR